MSQDHGGKRAKEKVLPVASPKPPLLKKKRKHKPEDFPKRPLSAYNIFFKETREELLATKQSGGGDQEGGDESADFQSMVKRIANRWKTLAPEERERVERMAREDLQRYKEEVKAYEEQMVIRSKREREEAAQHKKKGEEKTVPAASTSVTSSVDASSRSRLPVEDRGAGAETMARSSASSNLQAEQRGAIMAELHQLDSSDRSGESDLERLLVEEIRAMELIRSLKIRQISLARQIQSSNPESQILSTLDARRISLGLTPLFVAEENDMDMMRSVGIGRGILTPQNAAAALGLSSLHAAAGITRGDTGVTGSDYLFPTDTTRLELMQQQQEEAMLRNYSLRLREQELLNLHRQQQSLRSLHDSTAGMSELASHQRNLLATGGNIDLLGANASREAYEAALLRARLGGGFLPGLSNPMMAHGGDSAGMEIHYSRFGEDAKTG